MLLRSSRCRPVLGTAVCVLAFVLFSPDSAFAGRISLAWDPSPDSVAGYTVYYGTSPGNHPTSVHTTQTTLTIEGLTNGVPYYFVVKAYFLVSGVRIYSVGSNEVNGIPANLAPAITNPGPRTAPSGAFSLTVTASDPDGDSLSYSATGLPAGLAINSSTGRISGTVAAGTYTIEVTVNDGQLEAKATFTLTVEAANRAPVITNPGPQSTKAGPFTLTVTASDPDGDTLTFSATGLPAGLAINASNGTISGTVAAGTYTITVTVRDGALPASATFTLTATANRAPVITNPGAQTTMAGPFSLIVTASDPDGDALTYTASGLPAGIAINSSSGAISGTVAAGTYAIVVTVSDGALQASAAFSLTATANRPPTLAAVPDQDSDLDDLINLQLAGSDADGDTLTYAAKGLPPGLAIGAATGRITGIPSSVGDYSVAVTVSDGSLTASRSFGWTIVPLPPPVPISQWTFDEGVGTIAADVKGPNTGTLTNGASWTTGRSRGAVVLDGANDYVALPTFSVGGSALTIAAWVRVSSFTAAEQRFISKTGTTEYWTLGNSGSTLRFRLRTDATTTLTAAGALPAGTWAHVVATYDGAAMRLYLNGKQLVSAGKSGAIATNATAPVNIGRSPLGTGHLNGAIDDIRIFARSLTAAEIAVLHTEAPLPPPTPFTDDPLVPGVHSMRLVHITELRTRIDSLRLLRGLAPASWTPLVAGVTVMRASHITEMRAALAAVYAAAGRGAPAYTDGGLVPGMAIKAAHISELRAAVRTLE